jgi:hypothetical protein
MGARQFITVVKRLLNQRAEAGVLQLTLGIGIVISVISASMIILVYYSQMIFLQQNIDDRLRNNAASGIQYGMAMREKLKFNHEFTVDLFGEGIDTVTVIRKPWGIFEIIVSRARHFRHFSTRAAIISPLPDTLGSAAVYAAENQAPIYMAGYAAIKGPAYVPERKLTPGYISGHDFKGSKLNNKILKVSRKGMILIDTTLLHEVKAVYEQKQGAYYLQQREPFADPPELTIYDSLTQYIFSESNITLTESLNARVIIHSEEKIRVTANAKLSGVILIARDIDIDNEFEGDFQAFASRSITVGHDCQLRYPSALVLLNGSDSLIVIKHHSLVEGYVVIPGYDQTIASRGMFKLEKTATLHGMAYVNGGADIQGNLNGHITTKLFVATLGTGKHNAHILDGQINSELRSPYLPGNFLWGSSKKLTVAKWLE